MSAWLARARATIAAYCEACGGSDILSVDERTLTNRALHLIDELDDIEKALVFVTTCDALSVSPADLIEAVSATVENDDRKRYFRTAGELRFVLGVIAKRRAKAAAA